MHPTELSKGGHLWQLNCAVLALQCSIQASRSQHAIMRPERLLKYTRCQGFQQLFRWSLRQRLFRDRTAPLGNYIPRATRCLSNSPPSTSQASFCGSLWNKCHPEGWKYNKLWLIWTWTLPSHHYKETQNVAPWLHMGHGWLPYHAHRPLSIRMRN